MEFKEFINSSVYIGFNILYAFEFSYENTYMCNKFIYTAHMRVCNLFINDTEKITPGLQCQNFASS